MGHSRGPVAALRPCQGATQALCPWPQQGQHPELGSVWGASGMAQLPGTPVLQGHEAPEPLVPTAQRTAGSGTGQRRPGTVTADWCLPCPAQQPSPVPTGLQSHCPSPRAPRGWTGQHGGALRNEPGLPIPAPAAPPALHASAPGGSARRGRPRCLPWREAAPSSRRADGKQSMEFARLKVKYNTHTDFVRGPGTAAFAGSD